jgi:NAD(P)-dependent dehydrogenase (short-subunit alcohol dehydrogenase family)
MHVPILMYHRVTTAPSSVYDRTPHDFRAELERRIPLGRIADPKDVVGPVLFFAAPASGFVTGQILFVDGGYSVV